MNPLKRSSHRGQAKHVKRKLDIVSTPLWVIDKMLDWVADWINDEPLSALDPCAGDGRMIKCLTNRFSFPVTCQFDISSAFQSGCPADYYPNTDFFLVKPTQRYDLIMMNPPFSECGAFRFIWRAIQFWLKPEGRIICILPNYILDNSDKRKVFFGKYISRLAFLPKNTFYPLVPVIHSSIVELSGKGCNNIEFFINREIHQKTLPGFDMEQSSPLTGGYFWNHI